MFTFFYKFTVPYIINEPYLFLCKHRRFFVHFFLILHIHIYIGMVNTHLGRYNENVTILILKKRHTSKEILWLVNIKYVRYLNR